MGISDWFSRPKKLDPILGDLILRRRIWVGEVTLPELFMKPIPLEIQANQNANLTPFYALVRSIKANATEIKQQIRKEAFETYSWYVDEDLKSGNYTKAELAKFPKVSSIAEIWSVLTPFRLILRSAEADQRWILCPDVYWPNDHYFAAHFRGIKLDGALEVDR